MVNEIESIDRAIVESIDHYYNILKNVGYLKQDSMDKLLVLTFLADIIHDFPPLDEKDYNNLYKLWDCLASSECIIPWAEYRKYSGKRITGKTSMRVRISNNSIRVTNNHIRITQL